MLEITAVNEYQDTTTVRVRCPSCGQIDWVFMDILLGVGNKCERCKYLMVVSTEDVQEFTARMTEVINTVSGFVQLTTNASQTDCSTAKDFVNEIA